MNKKTFKYSLSFLLFCLVNTTLFAQGEMTSITSDASTSTLKWIWNNLVLVIGLSVVIGAILAFFRLAFSILEVEKLAAMKEAGIEIKKIIREPFLKRFNKKAWNITPIEQEKDIMLDHDYDGIKELNNHLPPWWLAMFYGCIVIGVVYFSYYHVFSYGDSQIEEYEKQMESGEKAVAEYLATQKNRVDESNVELLADAGDLAKGKKIFEEKCFACHGKSGEGGIGPNLTDEYWVHGGSIKNVFRTVKYGVSGKGMQAWKDQLRPLEMQEVSSYILSLQGTNPPNAKEPEGELYTLALEEEKN